MKRFAIAAVVVACGGRSPPTPGPVAPAAPGDAAEVAAVPDAGEGCTAFGAGAPMFPQKAIPRRTLTWDGTAIIER